MSLGTGALKVGREPERLRHSKEVSIYFCVSLPNQKAQAYESFRVSLHRMIHEKFQS